MTAGKVQTERNIFRAFEKSAGKHCSSIALKAEGGRGRHYTYSEVLQEVHRLAYGLSEDSFADCRQIGLISENRPEWAISYLAIHAAGKTVVPIDANLKANEIASIVGHAELKAIFCSDRFETALNGLSSDLQVFSFGEKSVQVWDQLFRDSGQLKPLCGDSLAVLIYTSGTTGSPKAVMLTHENILSNIDSTLLAFDLQAGDVMLSVLPLHHTFEATCGFLLPMLVGGTVVYARSLKSRELLQDIRNNGITVMVGVPLLYEKMYHTVRRRLGEAPLAKRVLFNTLYGISATSHSIGLPVGRSLFSGVRDKAGLGTIRLFASGAAALPMEIVRFFNLIGLTLQQGYGLTETSPVVSLCRANDNVFGSVGPPLDGVEVKIDCPDDQGIGEILVRGPNTTQGYKDNAEETAKLLRDGWLCTGDLGCIRDQQLWITGRQKNVIVSAAGKNIYPEELEERLNSSLYVMESLVLGRRKEGKQGEEVRAVIVPDVQLFASETGMDPENPDMSKIREKIGELVSEVNRDIAQYKRISGLEVQLEELEKTSTKKVKRFLYK